MTVLVATATLDLIFSFAEPRVFLFLGSMLPLAVGETDTSTNTIFNQSIFTKMITTVTGGNVNYMCVISLCLFSSSIY